MGNGRAHDGSGSVVPSASLKRQRCGEGEGGHWEQPTVCEGEIQWIGFHAVRVVFTDGGTPQSAGQLILRAGA